MGWPWQRQKQQTDHESRLEPLSDRKYEQLFLALLEDVREGRSLEQIQSRLGDRRNDRSFVSWLRRYGQKLLQQPAKNVALAPRMMELATAELGELSVVSKEVGERLLARAAESPPKALPGDEPPKAEAADRSETSQTAEGDDRAKFYFQQGNDACFNGDLRGAIAAYDQALSIKPDLHDALSNKGISLANLGRHEEAVAAYDQALSINPDLHGALYNKASDDAKTFFQTLKDTVTCLDAASVEVLKIFEKDVFTIENIAYRLDLPKEKVRLVLEDLWQRGYIYSVTISRPFLAPLAASIVSNDISQRHLKAVVRAHNLVVR